METFVMKQIQLFGIVIGAHLLNSALQVDIKYVNG